MKFCWVNKFIGQRCNLNIDFYLYWKKPYNFVLVSWIILFLAYLNMFKCISSKNRIVLKRRAATWPKIPVRILFGSYFFNFFKSFLKQVSTWTRGRCTWVVHICRIQKDEGESKLVRFKLSKIMFFYVQAIKGYFQLLFSIRSYQITEKY